MSSFRLRQLSGAGAGAELSRLAERLHLTVSGLVVLPLALLGWMGARLIGSKTVYLMVYAAVVVIALSWFVARRRLAVEVERSQLPGRMRVGQHVSVDLTLQCRRRVSMIMVEETLESRLGAPVLVPIAALKPGEEVAHRYSFTPSLRGVYAVGPTRATWSDPFGFTTHSQILADAAEVIVHPPVEQVADRVLTRMWEDPPIRPPVSKPWPTGFEFYGMREYEPGDDLRRIVWAAFAKTGRLLVRESEQGITDRVVILVDTNRAWHSPGEVSETFETAIKAAASIGVQHLREGFAVTLMTNEARPLDALRGERAELPWLDELARLERGDAAMLDAGLNLLAEAGNRPHFVVITPHLEALEAQQLKLILDRGLSVVIAKVLWDESDPMSLGRAASLGCQVVKVPAGGSLAAVFANQIGAGIRR